MMHDPDPCAATRAPVRAISLVVADLDGALLGPRGRPSPRTLEAVRRLRAADVALGVVGDRPPVAARRLARALGPGVLVAGEAPDAHGLPAETARRAVAALSARGLEVWLFAGDDWLVTRTDTPAVAHQARALGLEPTAVESLDPHLWRCQRVGGWSDDRAALARCERELRGRLTPARVVRSGPRTLDVVPGGATRAAAVRAMARRLRACPSKVLAVGSAPGAAAMFDEVGLGVAMGGAGPAARAAATAVTEPVERDGFALAIDRHVFGAAA